MSDALSDGVIDEILPSNMIDAGPEVSVDAVLEEAVDADPEETVDLDLEELEEQSPIKVNEIPADVSVQFHREVKAKLQKAHTEYRLLFTRYKRQSLAATDEFDIPEWRIHDGNDILRWEFNFKTVERTIWHPLFILMQKQMQEAQEEIDVGMYAFANITLSTVDELLDRSLAHNRILRGVLMNVEYPPPPSPPRTFIAAEIDLSEFDHVDGDRSPSGRDTSRGRGGRGGGRVGRRGRDARRDSSRGSWGGSSGRRESSQVRDDREPRYGNQWEAPRRRRDGGEAPYY